MKSMRKYVSKNLTSFIGLIILIAVVNIAVFVLIFQGTIAQDYQANGPEMMLQKTVETMSGKSSQKEPSEEVVKQLTRRNIWALFLDENGKVVWSADNKPEGIPMQYSIQEVAVFSKGYMKDYPVFVRSVENGLLVLGYPKDSYTKFTSNYYSLSAIRRLPIFAALILAVDLLMLFSAYSLSKRRIIRNVEPLVQAVNALSEGDVVELDISGELSEVAERINTVSHQLNRQNEARADWISGVSHDIRTPLSIILGYADKISKNNEIDQTVQKEADIIQKQSVKIKALIQDLNLVSGLEYHMQPLHKEAVSLAKVMRSLTADLLNSGIDADKYTIELEISKQTEAIIINCDVRLISRAVTNLLQNSMRHNPKGCTIVLSLESRDSEICLTVADDGVGVPEDKLRELSIDRQDKAGTDDGLNLRHGLGLLLVRQIVEAHHGEVSLKSERGCGFSVTMCFLPAG